MFRILPPKFKLIRPPSLLSLASVVKMYSKALITLLMMIALTEAHFISPYLFSLVPDKRRTLPWRRLLRHMPGLHDHNP